MKTYHVHHILVKAQYEAEDLLKKLATGANFEELAKKFSTCSSAPCGGDLGILKSGKADEDFEEAALKLKVNEISTKPVRTKFGYHLMKRIS
ncbi:MAG: peptidyl-prolyl cis-trans isomerase [Bdellovibrio sp.]|nr:peptidyl-prolyl cis-trans isomerase [Bdellovibrio sp.]